jgi:methylmalonyl-CoA/ethylmalonyl-CoA epimerase
MSTEQLNERLHHTAFVVESIAGTIESFCQAVGGSGCSEIFHDPLQNVRVAFIYPRHPGDPSIELVEPADPGSPVRRFLDHGGGLHHLCYEFQNFDEALRIAATRGLVLIRRAQPAVAFGGLRIAWFLSREKLLIEYLEGPVANPLADDAPNNYGMCEDSL